MMYTEVIILTDDETEHSTGADVLAQTIADRVRRARTDRGWTLDELARRSDVSKGAVVGIEQGGANPSISTLLKLADGLGLALTELIERPRPALVRVLTPDQAPTLPTGRDGRLTLLAATAWIGGSHVELWDWTLEARGSYGSEAHRAGTVELLHVRDGTLQVRAGRERHVIEEGSTALLLADVAHEYTNLGRGRLRMEMVVLEPTAGAERARPASRPRPSTGRGRRGARP